MHDLCYFNPITLRQYTLLWDIYVLIFNLSVWNLFLKRFSNKKTEKKTFEFVLNISIVCLVEIRPKPKITGKKRKQLFTKIESYVSQYQLDFDKTIFFIFDGQFYLELHNSPIGHRGSWVNI